MRSGALELADAKRSIQRSLLRSTIQWTRAWPSLLLAGGKRAPFSRRPSLTPESTTSWWIPVGFYEVWKRTHGQMDWLDQQTTAQGVEAAKPLAR